MSDKSDTFTNKYANTYLFASRQKKISQLFKKNIFKVITPNNVVRSEKVLGNMQIFNFCFANDIKDPRTNKTDNKSHLVVHFYNDKKKILVLIDLSKIPKVGHGIGFYLTAII